MAYSVSEDFRTKCYSGESLYNCRLIIGEETIPVTQISSITISSPIIDDQKETFYIGTFISQKLTIKFKNLDGIDTTSGTNVELYISQYVNDSWEEVPIGKYIIDESPENYHQTAEIECFDYAIKFATNLDYSPAFVDNKIAIDDLLEWICDYYGVALGDYPDTNGNVEIGTYDSTVSGKQWISYIAEIKGCNAKIDRLGQLTLVPLKSSPVVTIDALKSKSWELGEKFEVSQVVFFDAIRNYTFGDDSENTLYLRQDNPFITNREVVENVYEKLRLNGEIVEQGETFNIEDTVENTRIKELEMYGETEQGENPTPSSPQQVHVVSGDNTIQICGKNFYNIEGDFSVSNITITGTSEYLLITGGSPSTESKVDIGIAKLPAGTYTITNEFLEGNEYIGGWVYYKGTWTRPTSTSLGVSSTNPKAVVTFTLSEPKDVCFGFYYSNTRNYQNCKIRLQIEKGSTSTSFTPYRPLNSQLISLGMKNLIPTNTSDWEQGSLSTSGETPSTTRIRTIDYYPISNNTDYCVKVEDTNYCFLNIYLYDANKTYIEQVYDIDHSFNGATSFHFNLSTSFAPNVSYMRVVLRNSNNSATITASEIETIKPQMTIGTIPSAISDNPIELCKIGTYQDYIYKNNGVWYLHKEIGKVVIDQNTAGMYQSGNLTNTMRMAVPSGLILSNVTTNMMCDKLKILAAYSTDSEHIYMASNNFYVFVNKSRGVTDLASFKTWLNTNNLTCYAVLATSTDMEITDETLLSQLDDFEENAIFYDGVTNITSSLPITFTKLTSDPFICYSLTTENYGDVSLDAWDTIHYTLGDEDYYTLNNNSIEYAMTIMSKVETKIPTKQQEVTTNVVGGNDEVKIRRLSTEVNTLDNRITIQAEEIDENRQNISTLNVTANNIQANVTSSTNSLSTQINALADSTSLQINAISTQLEDGVEKLTNSLVTIDTNGIKTSKENETFNTQITNKTFEVKDRDKELAFIGYDTTLNKTIARIPELEARQITAGVHRCETITRNGNKRTAWFYVGGDN